MAGNKCGVKNLLGSAQEVSDARSWKQEQRALFGFFGLQSYDGRYII